MLARISKIYLITFFLASTGVFPGMANDNINPDPVISSEKDDLTGDGILMPLPSPSQKK